MPRNKRTKSTVHSTQVNNQPMSRNSADTQPDKTILNETQQPVISQTFQGSVHCSIIPTHEYQALLNENHALKHRFRSNWQC